MPGPLPKENARRRNKPRIPTSTLPAEGCVAPIPDPPEWVNLSTAGRAWWDWAWRTPQAAGWSPEAHLDSVAHRAQLEDDIAAIESEDFANLGEEQLRDLVKTLKGLVTGKSTILTRIKDYDDRLGLSPLSMAKLRWNIVESSADEGEDGGKETAGNVVTPDRWKRTGT